MGSTKQFALEIFGGTLQYLVEVKTRTSTTPVASECELNWTMYHTEKGLI